jgi:hypothetical protein
VIVPLVEHGKTIKSLGPSNISPSLSWTDAIIFPFYIMKRSIPYYAAIVKYFSLTVHLT